MDDLILLNIKGISYSQTQTGAYALILEEEEGERTLPIVIGSFEAQSIALALEQDIRPPRPLTHDLFVSVAERFNIQIDAIYIHKLEDGVFYSNIIFIGTDGEAKEIDSRTSDAIALAVRFGAPIYAYNSVMQKAGIFLEESRQESKSIANALKEIETETKPPKTAGWKDKSLNELEEMLQKAVQEENYEKAASIRDELSKRQKN